LTFRLFKGQQAFMPVEWRVKVTPVFDWTRLRVEEVGRRQHRSRQRPGPQSHDSALQEAFVERHICDLSDRFDFCSVEPASCRSAATFALPVRRHEPRCAFLRNADRTSGSTTSSSSTSATRTRTRV